ncbi:hypothetical protein pipiens_009347 [Culex pipiens pipiens]|uniref:AAA+ ATPase domain-containing protein n=1 Tax=Culex pipiens pipiens TaxID=38569 RepID=A0ABD1DF77_CULPP
MYLEENVHQTYVDVGVMARELQDRYREYNRRKTVPFRMLVEQAYKTVLHSYGLDSNPSSDNEEEGNSDLEVMEEGGGGSSGRNANHMNDTLTNMYMNSGKAKAGGSAAGGGGAASGGDGDAIDISSDEDDEGGNSRDKEKAVSTTTDRERMKVIETQIASNKHITVTKVTRGGAEKPRSGDEAVDSSNGSTNGRRAAEQQGLHQAKRRRLEQAQNSEVSNSNSNPLLPGYPAIVPAASSRNVEKQHQQKLPQPAKVAPAGGKSERPKRFKKEIWSKLVDTCFLDVGGMDKILRDLCELLLHVKHPEVYRHIGLPPPRGFLLHGPPGSGKTLLAHAIAGQLKIGLIEIAATELVAGVSGESEERIREVFEQAAILSPCVLFIDEIDAISANRVNAQKDMERRVVAQLLSSLDGLSRIEGGDEVLVIGATNRPDALDPALRRVGRFDQEISLGIPDRDARAQILKIICKNLKLEQSINYDELAKLTPGYVGADLLALVTRAATTAIKRMLTERERHQLLVEATRERDLQIQLRKAEQERLKQLAKKAVVDDEVMEVDESAKSKLNGNTSVDDVVALEDDVEEVVNLDDDKEEEKSAEAEKTTSEEEKKVDETADKDAAKPDEAEAKPAEGEDKKEAEGDEKKPDEEAKPAEAEAVAVVDDADVEMAADSSTPAEKDVVPVEEPKPSSTEVVEAPAESSEAVAEAEKPAEVDTSAETPAAAAEPQPDPEPESVQPSAKREGFITVPDVTWNDIGSLGDIREELKLAILAPVKFPHRLKMLGLSAPSGVLLCGPPGCGKTLLAKAVANEAGINFISVKGPELLNMYVGESERAVRQCFQRARNSAPCVIFFDEFDSLCPKRSDNAEGGAGMRVVNQLLTEMDGIEDRKGVFLMAATNRPDIVDPAVLRPGRLDKILYVGLPAEPDRADILRALTKNRSQPPLAEDVELGLLARLTEGYTGADLAGLVRQASLQTLKDSIDACDGGAQEEASSEEAEEQQLVVELRHFQEAIRNIKPSVNEEDKKHYERLKRKYGSPAAQ